MIGLIFNLHDWQRSVICLGYEITQLSHTNNLLSAGATERGEFFFSDTGVPLPRPSTALAWSSLCAFGPINGFISYATTKHRHFDPRVGNFLLPFLPKIRFGEDTNQSLVRTAKAHVRDDNDRIRWGNVFIADSQTGAIIEQLSDGSRSAKEWADACPRGHYFNALEGQHRIPPLYSYVGEGWQFGIIQNLPGIGVNLRDPFIELAKRGIPELDRASRCPKVRKLLIRFLELSAAKRWATAYANAMAALVDESIVREDAMLLATEIREAEQQRLKELRDKAKKPVKREVLTESLMQELTGIEKLLDDL